jgi:DNA polymerase-3 subunit gamma/tau
VSPFGAKVVSVDAPLALYRRYRPDMFADVIGQEHVTGPLSQALANNRVNHAYLFSGPRGCGKTTSARIMARALNCEQGPTATPCGVCDSCVELSTGGSGSLDVIEIDAASHGGVDDARDLRERAFFSPVRSRYKVYIIDEAHMVSKEGFNALLKLVEEPPSHLRFIFATTEPDKVIGTIKSRTHHYPFRLVAPKVLGDYLVELCQREGVAIEPTVVPLIVRAGGGSVRDSLSVLDQLIGGSGPEGVTYALTTVLLGYTPDTLLDETIDALTADDGGTLFGVIEKVIETGQDPRRFAEDLLHRLRDLVVVSAVPDAAARGLIEVPDDQADRLAAQSARFGRAELTRAADIVSQGLTDMRGATAPRLLLEMMCARILLPGLDQTAEGLGARIDRVERRLSVVGDPGTPASRPPGPVPPDLQGAPTTPAAGDPHDESTPQPAGHNRVRSADQPLERSAGADREPSAGADRERSAGADRERSAGADRERLVRQTTGPGSAPGSSAARPSAQAASGLTLVDARRLWPGVLERVKSMRRFSWLLLSQNAQVKDLHDGIITIGFTSAGAAKNFQSSGADEILHQALIDELGVDWRVEGIIDGPRSPTSGGAAAPGTATETSSAPTSATNSTAATAPPTTTPTAADRDSSQASASGSDAIPAPDELVLDQGAPRDESRASRTSSSVGGRSPQGTETADRATIEPNGSAGRRTPADIKAAKSEIRRTRAVGRPNEPPPEVPPEVSEDDPVIDEALTSHDLLARELGAEVIEDIRDDAAP